MFCHHLNYPTQLTLNVSCLSSDFDDQIGGNKDLADAAIAKLPAINDTIQKAIADNTKTQDILDAMAPHYKNAQDTIDSLTSTATKLEVWRPVILSVHYFISKNNICANAIIMSISQRD